MSVSIYYQSQKGKRLSTEDSSHTQGILYNAFGPFPLALDRGHIQTIEGIQAAEPNNPAWAELVCILNEYGLICLWIE